nr:methylmalonyl-CoA mutase [Hymenobacter elongatus]
MKQLAFAKRTTFKSESVTSTASKATSCHYPASDHNLLPARNADQAPARLKQLQQVAITNGNLFAELMETVKFCSLGQITNALFEVGGQYRRNM